MDWALSTQHKRVRNFCLYAWREYVTWESQAVIDGWHQKGP